MSEKNYMKPDWEKANEIYGTDYPTYSDPCIIEIYPDKSEHDDTVYTIELMGNPRNNFFLQHCNQLAKNFSEKWGIQYYEIEVSEIEGLKAITGCEYCHYFDSNNDEEYKHEYAKDSLGKCMRHCLDIFEDMKCLFFEIDKDFIKREVVEIIVETTEDSPQDLLREVITTGVEVMTSTDWESNHITMNHKYPSNETIYQIAKALKVDTSFGMDYDSIRQQVKKQIEENPQFEMVRR